MRCNMMNARRCVCGCVLSAVVGVLSAAQLTVRLHTLPAHGYARTIGRVHFVDTRWGLIIEPHLRHLSPGPHGFHVHEFARCAKQGKAAGGHFDPKHTGKHLGPYNAAGHLGDLPVLWVDARGVANTPMLAPRLQVRDLPGHSLIVHKGGDNYSDRPLALGGGGARVACGVIK